MSLAELLYRRNYRTKLPQLGESTSESEVKDRDAERKEKGKIYADKKRNAVESNIQAGDKVLMKQDKKNKLSTFFNPEPFRVLQKNGNSVLVEADTGVQYKRICDQAHQKGYRILNIDQYRIFYNWLALTCNLFMSLIFLICKAGLSLSFLMKTLPLKVQI